MKLVSINVQDGCNSEELLNYLKEELPDILLIQESWKFNGEKGLILNAKREIVNTHDLILENFLEYDSVFGAVLDTKIITNNGIEMTAYYGNAIYTKFPILEKEVFFFDLEYSKDFRFPKAGVSFDNQPRNIIKVRLDTIHGELNVSNIHGIYQLDRNKGDSERRDKMVDRILEVQSNDSPTIIGGDFNLEPNTNAIARLKSFYRELVTGSNIETTKVNKKQILDYMFVSDDIKVEHFKVRNVRVSNHYPLVLELDF